MTEKVQILSLSFLLMTVSGCKTSDIWVGRDLDIICKSHRTAFEKIQSTKNPRDVDLNLLSLTYWQNMENGIKSHHGKILLKKLSGTKPTKRYDTILNFAQDYKKVFDCLELREFYVYMNELQKLNQKENPDLIRNLIEKVEEK